jgi:hypothetical protein
MTIPRYAFRCRRFGWALVLALLPGLVWAVDRPGKTVADGSSRSEGQSVEMFQAIEQGQIDVKLIPKDSKQCNVLIENKTKTPLTIKLPDAFAAVPVLAQRGGGGARGGAGGRGGTGGGAQTGGGGMGGGGMMGGGMFNVAPEKVGQLKAPMVCLEHGKAEPRASIPYAIKPIESFTDKTGVRELCELLGQGQIDQRVAQAAAWHLSSGMSWEQLASKRLRFANGVSQPYFAPQEIQAAMQVTTTAVQRAEQRKQQQPQPSPGDRVNKSEKTAASR